MLNRRLFRKKPTPVFIDGLRITDKEYDIIDINRNIAVIRDPDKPEPEDYYHAASIRPEKYFEAKIEYNIDNDPSIASIGTISVYDPFKRGQHRGRALICHVLNKMNDNQKIWLSPSADPTPMNMNIDDGPCYGLEQEELEKYYKRFTYGKHRLQILFRNEMKKLCREKNKNK